MPDLPSQAVPGHLISCCQSWDFEGSQPWQGVRSGGAGLGVYVWSRQLGVYDDLLTQELPGTACQKLIRGGGILFKKPLGTADRPEAGSVS